MKAPTSVDWLEVISDNMMTKGDRFAEKVVSVAEHWPVALHGVGLSIAGADALDESYLKALEGLAQRLRPAYLSDHLCWSQYQGRSFYDLLPLPYTEAALEQVSDRLKLVQDRLGQRFYLENPSAYLAYAESQYSEAEFLAELCRRSDCGLLFDVNNLYVNHCNLGLDVSDYLRTIQGLPICYMHLAGHSDCGDIIIDTHDRPVAAGVWELYQLCLQQLNVKNTLIEWDADIPSLGALCRELDQARRIAAEYAPPADGGRKAALPPRSRTAQPLTDQFDWQRSLAALVEQDMADPLPTAPYLQQLPTRRVSIQRGIRAYQNNFRAFFLEMLGEAYPKLLALLGESSFAKLGHGFIDSSPRYNDIVETILEWPEYILQSSALERAGSLASLARFEAELYRLQQYELKKGKVSLTDLQSIQQQDWFDLKLKLVPALSFAQLDFEMHPFYRALDESEKTPPNEPECKPSCYRFYLADEDVCFRLCQPQEARLAEALGGAQSFATSIEYAYGDLSEASIGASIGHLLDWTQDHLILSLELSGQA